MSCSDPLKVLVLRGGRSSEHEVSLSSADAVQEGLIAAGHQPLTVTIERDGTWIHKDQRLSVTPGAGLLDADVVFPVLHGPYGEDGVVQGMLETLDVAYVGAGVAASALCMDKVMFKDLLSSKGVPQVDYAGVTQEHWHSARDEVLEELKELGLPTFVKPAHLGSSVGIVKVTESSQAADALDQAFTHDALVIVEAAAAGVEVECAVLGVPRQTEAEPRPAAISSEPGQISYRGDWYDFKAKYEPGGMELLIPAGISSTARGRVRDISLTVFAASGCEGLARVDFFVEGERVLVNELNTMPGFTPTSVYAKLWDASGVDYPQLLDRLCRLALERHARRACYSY